VYVLKRLPAALFIYGIFLFFFIGLGALSWFFGDGELRDLSFFVVIVVKLMMDFVFSIVLSVVFFRNGIALKVWLILQAVFIFLSTSSYDFYMAMISFISPGSAEVFSHIFGLKAVGFGIYHVQGAILYLFAAIFYFSVISNAALQKKSTLGVFICSLASLLVSRSALVPLVIYGFCKKPLFLIFLVFCLFFVSVSVHDGVAYRTTEIFRNIIELGSFSMASTTQNISMFTFPDDVVGYIAGYGRFFESGNELAFFKFTDLGVSRMTLYAGWPFLVLFLALNVFWVCYYLISGYGSNKNYFFAFLYVATFIILMFKDISFITVFGGVLFVMELLRQRGMGKLSCPDQSKLAM